MAATGAELQPHYHRELSCAPETVLQALRERFSADSGAVRIEFRGEHAQVSVDPADSRWWSPWLTFDVLEDEDGTVIEGRFGSKPAFFTLWMAALALALILALGAAIFAYSQYVAEQSPTGLWGFGIGTVLSFALAGLPLLGQDRARGQMQAINDALEECYVALECE